MKKQNYRPVLRMTPRLSGKQTMRYLIAGGSIITLITACFMYIYLSQSKEVRGNSTQVSLLPARQTIETKSLKETQTSRFSVVQISAETSHPTKDSLNATKNENNKEQVHDANINTK